MNNWLETDNSSSAVARAIFIRAGFVQFFLFHDFQVTEIDIEQAALIEAHSCYGAFGIKVKGNKSVGYPKIVPVDLKGTVVPMGQFTPEQRRVGEGNLQFIFG